MADVPNITSIIEQINCATLAATDFMRRHGMLLDIGCKDVPLEDEVDVYLRRLVLESYWNFNEAKDEARREEGVPMPNDWEIEGYAGDDRLFEVTLTGLAGAPRGFMTAKIFLRLV